MSYCRWSSDDFSCDLYCYQDSGGYSTHVAAHRAVYKEPLPPDIELSSEPAIIDAWVNRHQHVMEMLKNADRVDIGLPYDGQSFHDSDLGEFLQRLRHLKEVGYKFPDYVIEAVIEETKEQVEKLNTLLENEEK